MMRRDAFSRLRSSDAGENDSIQSPSQSVSSVEYLSQPKSALDFIPSALPTKKRDRKWERSHQDEVATYRGVIPEARQALISLAQMLNVPVDEVARAFLEFGVSSYETGEIRLTPYPKAQRMTLFSQVGGEIVDTKKGWLQEAFPAAKKTGNKQKKTERKAWEFRVTYRLPRAVKDVIKQIADRHYVPVGELVLYFFRYSLDAYQSGKLVLTPQPKNTGNSLF
jgi:hypothetical protein